MEIAENIPLDIQAVSLLFGAKKDLFLVWPMARYPFDACQWEEVLCPENGNVPFLVKEEGKTIGHAALLGTDREKVYSMSFLYLEKSFRGKGRGTRLVRLLETYAKEKLDAFALVLKVRTYNPRAFHCYSKCGFSIIAQEDDLIYMGKTFIPDDPEEAVNSWFKQK